MSDNGCWRLTASPHARDRRAHWFETHRAHKSLCGLVCVDESGMMKRDIVADNDAGVITCALCRHMVAAREDLRDLARRRRRDAD